MTEEIYVSTDVEADGPIPGPHSMLSFGSAAFRRSGEMLSTFSANLELLPGAAPDPRTQAWWESQPDAWAACRQDLEEPAIAMRRYVAWLRALPGKPVFVGYPAAYDFMFVYWYVMRFAGESPFSHSALDIKTAAMLALGKPYREATKKNMPRRWFGEQPHTHVALDDAIGQGMLFCNILKEFAVTGPIAS
ncbi:MAG TPA: exonuclease [Thermoanaerobaculia bacterium]|nr:exonuclease [Thermoanaerobaculia bacterium]